MKSQEKNIFEKVKNTIQENLFGESTKKKPVRVQFDKMSDDPFVAEFSERGFLIDGTRLSFESIEDALSKEYIITFNEAEQTAVNGLKNMLVINNSIKA